MGTLGDGLTKYGRARCKLAVVSCSFPPSLSLTFQAQEEFGARLIDNYIAGMGG